MVPTMSQTSIVDFNQTKLALLFTVREQFTNNSEPLKFLESGPDSRSVPLRSLVQISYLNAPACLARGISGLSLGSCMQESGLSVSDMGLNTG